jgi:hypothetical protein
MMPAAVVKQLGCELVSSIVIGLPMAAVSGQAQQRPAPVLRAAT